MTTKHLDLSALAKTLDRYTFVATYLAWATRTASRRELTHGLRVRFVRGAWQVDMPGVEGAPVLTRGDAEHVYDVAFRRLSGATMDAEKLRVAALS